MKHATEHCKNNVKKFDYAAFRVAAHMPAAAQPHYFAINSFFLEVLRSREISRERSICQTRLHWWRQTLVDVENKKAAREPLARMLKDVHEKSRVNFKLLHRMIDYQLFDIDRGSISTMQELEVYAENTRSLMLYMNLHLLNIDDERANLMGSHLGRALGICDVIRKSPYYIAIQRGYLPVDVLLKHNVQQDKIYRRQDKESLIAEEFYDAVLEIAAYARKHLQISRQLQDEAIAKAATSEGKPLPKHMHRAFLLS